MRLDNLFFILLVIVLSCSSASKEEIAQSFIHSDMNGETKKYSSLLSHDAVGVFVNSRDTILREGLMLNHKFSKQLNPWAEIFYSSELNDSVIELHVLETNELHYYFDIDTIGYRYLLTISDLKVRQILLDTIPNLKFDYH